MFLEYKVLWNRHDLPRGIQKVRQGCIGCKGPSPAKTHCPGRFVPVSDSPTPSYVS